MIRFAKLADIDAIMHFIDQNWRKGHILARDRQLFEWMYLEDSNSVNFVISLNDDKINGILGFIPYNSAKNQIALTIWKALKDENAMVGVTMLSFLEKELLPTAIVSPGINPKTTTAIYKYFKYDVGKMRHYYRLANVADFYIPVVKDKHIPVFETTGPAEIHAISEYDELKGIILANNAINKDEYYIKRRYFEHPVFEYIHYIVNGKLDIILREQNVNEHKCIRVVDMLGDFSQLICFTTTLDKLLVDNKYEYIDCYVAGVDASIWEKAGWLDVDETQNIIPNYFSPFERTKVDLYYSSKPKKFAVFRGDGDQDRPN